MPEGYFSYELPYKSHVYMSLTVIKVTCVVMFVGSVFSEFGLEWFMRIFKLK